MITVKTLFIINPISGGKDKSKLKDLIEREFYENRFQIFIVYSDYPGHANKLATNAVSEQFDLVVAVGGDGTLNEVASALVGTSVKFGLLPFGSGNGLARHLKIPLNTKKALQTLKQMYSRPIDTGVLNGRAFFNIAGVGLDAKIAHIFSTNKKRGFKTYIKLVLKEMIGLKGTKYKITIDGTYYDESVYVISIANSPQYGNDMNIAADASVIDGSFDVCVISEFPMWMMLWFGIAMKFKALKSSRLKIIKGREIEIERSGEFFAHVDGEPLLVENKVKINVLPLSLNVILPNLPRHEI